MIVCEFPPKIENRALYDLFKWIDMSLLSQCMDDYLMEVHMDEPWHFERYRFDMFPLEKERKQLLKQKLLD